jgi:hypothetical protein
VLKQKMRNLKKSVSEAFSSELCAGLMTPYHGTVVLWEATLHYSNPVCGLPTAYAGNRMRLAFSLNRAIARAGGRETTNETCRCSTWPITREETAVRGHETRAQQNKAPHSKFWPKQSFTAGLTCVSRWIAPHWPLRRP